MRTLFYAAVLCSLLCGVAVVTAAPHPDGELEIRVVDADTGQPIAARILLKTTRGRAVKVRLPDNDPRVDYFYIDGSATLPLKLGQYEFELEAGPEYRTQSGHFEIERHADDVKTIEMHRFADLAKEGWWAGDLDAARPTQFLPLAVRAENLNVVADRVDDLEAKNRVVASTDATRVFDPVGQLDERLGGGLLLFNLSKPLDLSGATRFKPTSLQVLREARAADGVVVARTPFAWDMPLWLASGELDAIDFIHHHALASGVVDDENGGRPRDKEKFGGRMGNGRWSEAIYYHSLNCGLRIPPAAGSGAGENENPVGTNRVYVYCGDEFSAEAWWQGLAAGRVFVTNGPLLRPTVRGERPGYVFHLAEGGPLKLEVGLNLATRVPVEYLEIIKNGEVDTDVRLDKWAAAGGHLPPVTFDESGWFLVRAVTTNAKTYQFASTGPYYVERGGRPRISRKSVQFFLDWIDEAVVRLRELPDIDESARKELLAEQATARKFFEELITTANAD